MAYIIRQATQHDVPSMADISRRVHSSSAYTHLIPAPHRPRFDQYYSDSAESRSRLSAKLANQVLTKGATFFVAEEAGQIIGYVGVLRQQGLARMRGLFVESAQQGRGIGRALLTRALEHVGNVDVQLKVLKGNERARVLYEKCGFEQVGIDESGFFGAEEVAMIRYVDKID